MILHSLDISYFCLWVVGLGYELGSSFYFCVPTFMGQVLYNTEQFL